MSAACWISSLNKLLDVDVGFWSLMCWQALVFAYWWQRHSVCHQLHSNNWRQHFCHRLNRCCNKPGVLPLCLLPHFKIHGVGLFLIFFSNMSYQSPSCFMSSKHLLTTNTTSASRHSRNNCGRVHPFPNSCCGRTVSLRIWGELVSTHLCVWFSEEITNKIQAKTCNVRGKTDGQILLVSTGNCNSGWERAAPGYVHFFQV